MAIDGLAAHSFKIDDPESLKNSLHDPSLDDKDMGEIRSAMEDLNEVDVGLAYSSEKLVNLDNLLMHLLGCENDFESVTIEDDNFSQEFIEKALTLDLLHAILVTEVRELDNFISSLQALTVGARDKIFSCEKSIQFYNVVGSKLHDCEESLRQSHERIIEMKMQLAKLQMTSLTLNQSEWRYNTKIGLSEVSGIHLKPQMQTIDKRLVLRMLEKSLARELDLEKKLSELNHNEEDLKLKLHLTEQIALHMEEAAEVTWARFLEAENTVEVLMGISKEMVGRLQMVNFHLNGSITREQELKVKLQDCFEQLNAKEIAIQKLNSSVTQLAAENSEVSSLREKVILLENKLRESESQLKEANACNEASQEQLREMDTLIESLKENIDVAESRAQDAESKITELTDANMELSEELTFLKGRNDKNTEKVSSLEKQLRESELQLQHSRASSEASQEQQNMLYSAIWDMETLIDELKQKASKSEFKIENTEEQCMLLTETNIELSKELDFMRARVELLETSLSHTTIEKIASAKDINIKTNLVMDMIMQLATERERIQKQLYSLRKENKILKEKLQKPKKNASENLLENEGTNDLSITSSRPNSRDAPSIEPSEEMAAESSPICSQNAWKRHLEIVPQVRSSISLSEKSSRKSSQAENTESLNEFLVSNLVKESRSTASASQTETVASISGDDNSNLVTKLEAKGQVGARRHSRIYIFMAVFVLLLSVLAACLFDKKQLIFDYLFS